MLYTTIDRFRELPSDQRNHFALAALREKFEETEDTAEDDPGKFPNPLRREDSTPEEIAAIERGLADIDAGRVTDGDTAMRRLFARVGLSYPADRDTRRLPEAAQIVPFEEEGVTP